jgi:hypothetical protein
MGKIDVKGQEVAAMSPAQRMKAIAEFIKSGIPVPPMPSGPVPMPYPNLNQNSPGGPSDRTVGVGGKAIVLKEKSDTKSSTGDDPATKQQKWPYMARGISPQGAAELVQGLPISSMADRLRILSMLR